MNKHLSDSSKCFWSESLLIHINISNQMHILSCLPNCDLHTCLQRQQTLSATVPYVTENTVQFYHSSASLKVDLMYQDPECINSGPDRPHLGLLPQPCPWAWGSTYAQTLSFSSHLSYIIDVFVFSPVSGAASLVDLIYAS